MCNGMPQPLHHHPILRRILPVWAAEPALEGTETGGSIVTSRPMQSFIQGFGRQSEHAVV
jgi:hypothetical protein